MASTDSPANEHRCLRCNRPLKSARSRARRYGDGCWAKVRAAASTVDLSAWTASQVEDARLAIEDGAVVPSTRPDVFHVVSSDGTEVYRTHRNGCVCTNGLKTLPPRPCWHRCAVTIMIATHAPASRPALTPAPVVVPAPAPAPQTIPARDIWAELEALGAIGSDNFVPAF